MNRAILFLAAGVAAGGAAAQQPPPEATFRAGTRLVEVEVVVRGKRVRPPGLGASLRYFFDSGPPFGPPGDFRKDLTRDDFTLLDQGKPQPIAIFSAGLPLDTTVPLVPGAASNRTDGRGQPLNDVTVVLIDLLNTPWALTAYAREGAAEFLRSIGETRNRIALYSLGERLHILHDFTDDPEKLAPPHGELPPEYASALGDYGDLLGLGGSWAAAADIHGQITVKALRQIIQHVSGIPGRKNLVWVSQIVRLPPAVMTMLQQANIVLYPVAVRGGGFTSLESDLATRELGISSGGRAFFDARDLVFAVQTAEEDSHGAYLLGYYPPQKMLDGKFHKVSVNLNDAKVSAEAFEIHYRSGYLATKVAAPPPTPTLAEAFENPLNTGGISLAAQAVPETEHPGLYDLRVTVDLHDIRLDRKPGHSGGLLDYFVLHSSSQNSVKSAAIVVNLTDDQLVDALENGYTRVLTGIEPDSGEFHIVVRDHATGNEGSLKIEAEGH